MVWHSTICFMGLIKFVLQNVRVSIGNDLVALNGYSNLRNNYLGVFENNEDIINIYMKLWIVYYTEILSTWFYYASKTNSAECEGFNNP